MPDDEPRPVRLRSVALPVEHGGWGLLGEPLLLALLVAPSTPGLGIAVAAVFAFFAHHPLKLAAADWRRRRRTARTVAAERFVLLYAAVAAGGLALAAPSPSAWWLPLAGAAPLALAQLAYDVRNKGRELLPEVLGAVALGSGASAALLAGGSGLPAAAALWALVAAKAAAAILYVRARLRLDRGLAVSRAGVFSVHALGLALALAMAGGRLAPRLASAAFVLLLARAVHGLSRTPRRVRPQVVGITEVAYGLVFVTALAMGYRLGL